MHFSVNNNGWLTMHCIQYAHTHAHSTHEATKPCIPLHKHSQSILLWPSNQSTHLNSHIVHASMYIGMYVKKVHFYVQPVCLNEVLSRTRCLLLLTSRSVFISCAGKDQISSIFGPSDNKINCSWFPSPLHLLAVCCLTG